jgi:hypothetical protein
MFSDLPSWNPFSWPYWRERNAHLWGNLWIRDFPDGALQKTATADVLRAN